MDNWLAILEELRDSAESAWGGEASDVFTLAAVEACRSPAADVNRGWLVAEVRRLEMELTGEQKSSRLLTKGLESVTELYDGMKHENRRLRDQLAAARAGLEPLAAQMQWVHANDDDKDLMNVPVEGELRVGDVRRAAALLAAAEPEGEK